MCGQGAGYQTTTGMVFQCSYKNNCYTSLSSCHIFVLPHFNSVKFHASAQFYLVIIFLVASVDHTLPYDEEE